MGTVSSQTESPEGAVASVVALAPQPAAGTVALAPQPAAGTVALAPQPAAGTVALAPQPAAGTAAGWQLPHVRQRHSWDCGLACVEMVLRCGGGSSACDWRVRTCVPPLRCRARGVAVDAAALAAEVGTRSTWTADLAHLLARRVPGVVYWTTFAGVRTSHAGLAFYGSRGLREDAPRVARLLGAAPSVGLRVVEVRRACGGRRSLRGSLDVRGACRSRCHWRRCDAAARIDRRFSLSSWTGGCCAPPAPG